MSGSCAVTHSTMSSARRHFSAARRAASGWLRSLIIFTTSSSIMLAEVSSNTRMRLPLICSALMYLRVAAAAERLDAIARGRLVERAALQALDAFFERLDVGHELVDVLAAREAVFVVHRRLLAALP